VGFFSRWKKRKASAPPRLFQPEPEPQAPFPVYENVVPPSFVPPKSFKKSHIIVFANEKGGVGKSTAAFHTCIALCNAGEKVAAADVDLRQLTLDRALFARIESAREYGVELPGPVQIHLSQATEAEFETKIRMAQIDCSFVVIDVGGHDSPIARRAIFMADTIVTPVNDSFIDLDMLGRIDPRTGEMRTLGEFARLVEHLKEPDLRFRQTALDWVVMQNRSRSLATKNERGFRLVPGLRERVVYRELFPLGLTLFDLELLPDLGRAQPAARAEIFEMLNALNLPSGALLHLN
jgi:chromosome partitioning protein